MKSLDLKLTSNQTFIELHTYSSGVQLGQLFLFTFVSGIISRLLMDSILSVLIPDKICSLV